MTETTKTLHQRVSSLIKNPKRVKGVIKEAGVRFVPPSHYLKGKNVAEAAEKIKQLKAPKGLNGETPVPGASKFFKEASLLDTARGLIKAAKDEAAKGAAAGAAIGAASTAGKIYNGKRILERGATARGGVANPKTIARLAKTKLKRSIPGIAGAAAIGAAAGAAIKGMKKEASIASTANRAGRAVEAFKARTKMKPVFEMADVKGKAKAALKKAVVPAAVLAGGVAVTKKNESMKKEASELVMKDGKKYRKGTVASAANKVGTAGAVLGAIKGKGIKQIAKGALSGSVLGGGYGTLRGANRIRKGEISLDKKEMSQLTKKAAEKLTHKGVTYRRGTVGSAAKKMAVGGAALGAGVGMAGMGPAGGAMAVPGAAQGAVTGALYGLARGVLRAQKGERSMAPAEFDRLKHRLTKEAAELIIRDGKKYRKGNDASATALMGGINATLAVPNAVKTVQQHRTAGIKVPTKAIAKYLGAATAAGAATGYIYSKVRGIGRDRRGETSVSHTRFQELKKKAELSVGDKGTEEMKKVVKSGGKSGKMAQMKGSDKGPKGA